MPQYSFSDEFGFADDEDNQSLATPAAAPIEEGAPEAPADMSAPGAFSFADEFGYDETEPPPLPDVEPQEAGMLGQAANQARHVMDRISDLVGGTIIAAGEAGEALQDRLPVPGLLWGDEEGIRLVSGEEYNRVMAERKAAAPHEAADMSQFLSRFGAAAKDLDFDYEPLKTWEDVKASEGAMELVANTGQFILDQGVGSVVDMAAILTNMPGYLVARSGEIAQNRAEVDRRDEVTEEDLAIGTATSLVVSALERFGAEKVLGAVSTLNKDALRRIITAMGAEAMTEFTQEGTEYIGERIGQVEMSLAEGFDRALAGAVGGAGVGGAIRTGVEAVAAVTGTDLGVGGDDTPVTEFDANAAQEAIQKSQQEAQDRVAAGGGDLLDQALAGAEVGETVGAEVQTARESVEAAFEQAEAEAATQKEAEIEAAEYQAEVQRGEGTAVIEEAQEAGQISEPEGPTLGEVSPALTELKEKLAAPKPRKPAARKPIKAPKLIEDLRPIVVTPEGEAMTAQELDNQIREHLKAQGVTTNVNTTEEGQVDPIPVKVAGIDVRVENPKGTRRNGRTLKDHYGDIPAVEGADGDPVDVFLGSQAGRMDPEQPVFIVDQMNEDGSFDEHKVMLGYPNELAARRAYKRNYDQGWKMGPVSQMSMTEFKTWLDEGGTKAGPIGAETEAPGEVISGEQELLAMQARESFKGRKKPKILYRVADEESEVVISDRGEGIQRVELLSPDGENIGGINLRDKGDTLQVSGVLVDPKFRQKGHGQRLIVEALKAAYRAGKKLVSDEQVTVAQLRAYDGLRSEGFIIEYADEAAVEELMIETSNFSPENLPRTVIEGNGQPVVSRIDFGEAQSILYRDITEEQETSGPAATLGAIQEGLQPLLDEIQGIEVLNNPDEAPQEMQAQMRIDQRLGAKGLYDAESGTIYVFADNHRTVDDVARTILHEGVAHKGLRLLLGDKLPGVLESIWEGADNSMVRQIKKVAEAYGLNLADRVERAVAVEEYVAHLAETSPKATTLQQIKDLIRQFLRQVGLLETWNEADIDALLRDSRRNMRGKPLNRIEFTEKVRIEETGEVVELVETADRMVQDLDRRRSVADKLKACVAA